MLLFSLEIVSPGLLKLLACDRAGGGAISAEFDGTVGMYLSGVYA